MANVNLEFPPEVMELAKKYGLEPKLECSFIPVHWYTRAELKQMMAEEAGDP